MLCYGDIFLLSQQKYITCQKISYLCDTKKLISFFFFLHHNFSIFIFYITHCQHVDLRRGDPENKKTFNPPFYSPVWYTEAVTKQELLLKKGFLLSRFNVCKTSERSSYFSKVAGLFLPNFAKINTITVIFQGFSLDFKQFSIVCNVSRRPSSGRFRKF